MPGSRLDPPAEVFVGGDPYWPVSVKGVVLHAGRVLLAYNERDEWELPGGRLEQGESLAACVEREVFEETGLSVKASRLLDACVFEVVPGKHVVVIAYQCQAPDPDPALVPSDEHDKVAFVGLNELDTLNLPRQYRTAIGVAAEGPAAPSSV